MNFLQKLSSLNNDLVEACSSEKRVCLWLSGGKDSILLFEAMRNLDLDFAVLHFDDGLSRRQKRTIWTIIQKYKETQIFSYPARTHLLIGKYRKLALASYYPISDEVSFPVVRDLIEGEKCAFDLSLETSGVAFPPIEFDTHIRGSRFADSHWSLKSVLPSSDFEIKGKRFLSPLASWSRAEVLKALEIFGYPDHSEPVEQLDTGNISVCSKCLSGKKEVFCPKQQKYIPPAEWDQAENLKLFRTGKSSLYKV